MKRTWVLVAGISLLALVGIGSTKEKQKETPEPSDLSEELVCVGGDAINYVNLMVRPGKKEDIVELEFVTGEADVVKEEDKHRFTTRLGKGALERMKANGRIELTLSSVKHPDSAFGGETSYAAFLDLAKDPKGHFVGYLAAEGSVFQIDCSKGPWD